jgi:hypothetical protein
MRKYIVFFITLIITLITITATGANLGNGFDNKEKLIASFEKNDAYAQIFSKVTGLTAQEMLPKIKEATEDKIVNAFVSSLETEKGIVGKADGTHLVLRARWNSSPSPKPGEKYGPVEVFVVPHPKSDQAVILIEKGTGNIVVPMTTPIPMYKDKIVFQTAEQQVQLEAENSKKKETTLAETSTSTSTSTSAAASVATQSKKCCWIKEHPYWTGAIVAGVAIAAGYGIYSMIPKKKETPVINNTINNNVNVNTEPVVIEYECPKTNDADREPPSKSGGIPSAPRYSEINNATSLSVETPFTGTGRWGIKIKFAW